jgi:tRNA modification GTPase
LPLILPRHQPLLESAQDALGHCLATIANYRPADLLSIDLNAAISSLGQITGETATVDIIDRIFHDFCIGK